MNSPILTSKDNPLVRTIRQVAHQTRRSPPGLAVAEGLRVIEEATAAGRRLEALLVSEDFGTEPREARLLDLGQRERVTIRRASAALFKGLSDVVSPQGALALVRFATSTLADVRPAEGIPLVLCLCGIQDPGNLGTLARSARAAGVTLICTTAGTVSARNPKAIRASAGSLFHMPIAEGISPAEFRDYCRRYGITMYQARGRAPKSCWAASLRGSTAFILGNEARGLSAAEWPDVAEIGVPMISGIESLNVAIAGAVLLFEAFRQRSFLSCPQDQDLR